MQAVVAPTSDRQSRRRRDTHDRLVRAAGTLFARQGVDNTRINEITEEADVGFGSFYNHFENKEAIAQTVVEDELAAQGAAIGAFTADLDDPAEVISTAHRSFVHRAASDPAWGRLLVRLDASHDILASVAPFARRDLRRGIEMGRLQVSDETVALFASGGALLAVIRAVLNGHAPENADIHHAEGVLRMFGLDADAAADTARRPLPEHRAASEGAGL
jgi:AcrR family transcriptional regulator